eukprot:TRINITY_DN1278_c0_g3_i1.p1 TRINITY_DN1278_c0_g3~~TRINITY_DN1278_c0_g3_i1.p1  ORF type:complete len:164 (-),score=42.90 TRINITY_DN1278_c0_g3_i1:238-729(-)
MDLMLQQNGADESVSKKARLQGGAEQSVNSCIKDKLIPQVDSLLSVLGNTCTIIEAFDPQSQEHLFEQITTIHHGLGDLLEVSDALQSVKVPKDITESISQGQNPFLHSSAQIESGLKLNRAAYGKLRVIQAFRHRVQDEICKAFPEEYEAYLAERARRSAAS